MSKTLAQIFAINPTATIANTDLFYLVQAPYTPGTDAAITGANLKTALGIGTILPGLAGDLAFYNVGGTTLSPLATATNGLLITNALGHPSILSGPGTNNHLLVSNAAGSPSWSVPTYPNASVAAGKIIISDGTNYIASTPTYPNSSGTSGKIIISDGTNNIYSTPTYPNASALAGKVIISDGTNFIASTSIFPNTVGGLGKFLISDGTSNVYSTSTIPTSAGATPNKVLLSDGTNYVLSTPTFPNASATLNHFIISDGTNWTASASAINLAGSFTTSGGAFSLGFTLTNNTSLTLPTSGTLATTAQLPSLPLAPGSGGTGTSTVFTTGSVIFAGAAGVYQQDNANLFWDETNKRLGIGTALPSVQIHIVSNVANDKEELLVQNTNAGGPNADAHCHLLTASGGGNPHVITEISGVQAWAFGVDQADANTWKLAATEDLATSTALRITTAGAITTGIWNASVIPLLYGGSNAALTANNGGIVWSNASQMQILAGTATARQMLQSGATATPAWSTATWPATTTANQLLYSSSLNTVGGLTSANNGLLVTNNTGVPSILAGPGTTGNILQSNAATAPSFSTATYPSVATTTGTILRADGTNWVKTTSTFADTYAINTLLYAGTANTVTGLAPVNSAFLTTTSGGVPTWSTSVPVLTIKTQLINATGAFTYTRSTGCTTAIFELQGGGASSGGSTGAGSQAAIAGAGGSGAYMRIRVDGVTNLSAITGSVGAKGAAPAAGNNNGNDGGDTTLIVNGGSTWTAGGGKKGTGAAASGTGNGGANSGAGGANTTGTNATLIASIAGQTGKNGAFAASGGFPLVQAFGGNSALGLSGSQFGAGTGYGAGADSWRNNTGSNQPGIAGTDGVVIVTEFCTA